MSLDLISSVLLGQSWLMSTEAITLLKLFLAIPLPIYLGTWLAKRLRMPDYGWKLSLIFCTLALAGVFMVSFPLRLGVDLKGGVILVYEIDREARQADDPSGQSLSQTSWQHLQQRLTDRINPSGTKEIVVRRHGDWEIEIIIPDVDTSEVERIKKLISTAGSLEFRIVANSVQHGDLIQAAVQQAEDPLARRSKYVMQDKRQTGFWARVGRDAHDMGGFRPLKVQVANYTIRNSSTGEIIHLPSTIRWDREYALEHWLKDEGIHDIDVLMYTGDEQHVTGENLGMVSSGNDEMARPCVLFNMKASGAGLMGGLTGENLPDEQRGQYSLLGIMLDGTLLSAPRVMSTITDSGRITGQFTREEVDFLVGILQAGSLPAALKKVPIAQNTIGAMLGEETIHNGKVAAGAAMLAVFAFILFWYRRAGLVACLMLAANLLFVVAAMKFPLRAPLTLPGLAGLVLTVGMAVDANVLIVERIREEIERGAALRMAIRNGFDRATLTIMDSNITTLLTAVVMYVIGTDQIRGFAITLTLGILISMFTAIFCSRVVFDIFERKRYWTTLRMTNLFGTPNLDFLGKKYLAIAFSLLFIVTGLVATAVRGKQIFDIDFLGGTSVTMILKEPAVEREIRSKLDQEFSGLRVNDSAVQYSLNRVDVEGQPENTVWKLDSSLEEVEQLQDILQRAFPVATQSLAISEVREKHETVAVPDSSQPATKPEPTAEMKAEPAPEPKPEAAPEAKPEAAPKAKSEAVPETKPEPTPETKPDAAPEMKPEPELKPEPAPEAAPEPKPEVKREPASESKPEAKPEPESKPEAKPEPTPEVKPEAAPEPKPEPTPESKSDADPEMKPEPAPESKPAPEPESKPEPAREAKPEATPEPKPAPEPEPQTAPESKPEPAPESKPEPAPESKSEPAPEPKPESDGSARTDLPPATMLALAAGDDASVAPPDGGSTAAAQPPSATGSSAPQAGQKQDAEPAQPSATAAPVERQEDLVTTQATLDYGYAITGESVLHEVRESAEAVDVPLTDEDVQVVLNARDLAANPDWTIQDAVGYKQWHVTIAKNQAEAGKILDHLQQKVTDSPVWSTSNKIGGKVAEGTRKQAVYALVVSWALIVMYLWIRFQKVAFGLAAVLALIHDVLVAIGAIALSYWLSGALGFLGIHEFKISLTVVVALLTIVGYSVNDTIVIFDRIREIRGKSADVTEQMVNTSINNTLSRTMLTSFTTLLSVVVLFVAGGEELRAFSFTLLVGFVVGTYSSIYIAPPFVLWLYDRKPAPRSATS